MSENPLSKSNVTSIVERAKELIVDPRATWHDIDAEAKPPRDVLIQYALPLAAIGPIAGLIGSLLFGYGPLGFRFGIGTAISMALSSFVLSILSLYLMAWIANLLSPKFGGKNDFASAFRLVAYAMTAAWVAGIFALVPMLSILGLLGLYSIYLFYTGVRPIMNVNEEQAAVYTIVVFIAAIIVNMIVGSVVTRIGGMPTLLI